MSLYYDAASILTSSSNTGGGSFKSRIYSSHSKASPAQIYALITEASKWDILLKEVIENAGIFFFFYFFFFFFFALCVRVRVCELCKGSKSSKKSSANEVTDHVNIAYAFTSPPART